MDIYDFILSEVIYIFGKYSSPMLKNVLNVSLRVKLFSDTGLILTV